MKTKMNKCTIKDVMDMEEILFCALSAANIVAVIRDCVGDKLTFDEKYEIAVGLRESFKDMGIDI